MEYRKCILCNKEKTKRQMSLRDPRLCRSCMMSASKEDKLAIAHSPVLYNATYSPQNSCNEPKPIESAPVKKQVIKTTSPMLSKSGYRTIKTPTLPKVRSHMPEFGRLNDEEKRKVLAAEYKFKKMSETR